MSRVRALTQEQVNDGNIVQVLARQQQRYGAVLPNHAVLARRPDIFRGFRAMWDGLEASGLLGARLACLINVRVAALIGCGL